MASTPTPPEPRARDIGRGPRRHTRFPWPPVVVGAALALALLLVGVATVPRTEWGREKILEYTLTAVGGRLNGRLDVARLDGNLFSGARLHGVMVRDSAGAMILGADSADLEYRLPSFFGGDVLIQRLTLFSPDLYLRRLPGDSLWNYQHLLLDTTRVRKRPGRATLIERLRVVDGDVRVQLPWTPNRHLTPAEQRLEVRAALSDTGRVVVRRVPGGMLRSMSFQVEAGLASRVYITSDERGGTYVEVDSARGTGRLFRGEPLQVRQLEGSLVLREGVLRYRAPTVVLPRSRLTTEGAVGLGGAEPVYDLRVAGRNVALADLQWIYPLFPDRGDADFRLLLETHPDGLFFRTTGLRLSAPGTRVTGRFDMLWGRAFEFSDVDLRARPLDVRTVEGMFPLRVPVTGLQIGAAEIRSPAS